MSCNTFWVNDIKQLLCDFTLIPSTDDSLEAAMNKITRIAIILSIVIAFFSVESGVVVLVISFVFIISFYYGNKSKKANEAYTETKATPVTVIPRLCDDVNDPDYVSKNQLLVGFGNPKTRVQPIIAPPSHDSDSWGRINNGKCTECMYVPCMCSVTKKISFGNRTTSNESGLRLPPLDDQNYSNIYDPRFTGYGDQYRTYEEPVTGQTRFFYKDVDAIKMPNYIVRSKVDTLPWAPTYGPDKPVRGDYGDYKNLANDAFHDSTLTFRAEMQESLMRKRNAEMWQRRVSPINKGQQLGLGANKSCL